MALGAMAKYPDLDVKIVPCGKSPQPINHSYRILIPPFFSKVSTTSMLTAFDLVPSLNLALLSPSIVIWCKNTAMEVLKNEKLVANFWKPSMML
jgi:hypothetical protein